MIPVLVKIYKLLINELSSQLEIQLADGDEDGEWEDVEDDIEDLDNGGDDALQSLVSQLTADNDFTGMYSDLSYCILHSQLQPQPWQFRNLNPNKDVNTQPNCTSLLATKIC